MHATHRDARLPWMIAGALFLLPVIASVATREVRWNATDFAIFAAMLAAAAGGYRLLARRFPRARLFAAAGVALLFLLVWAELAVGILD